MLDNPFIQGAVSGYIQNKTSQALEQTITPDSEPGVDYYIKEIHRVLIDLTQYLQKQEAVNGDIFKYITLFKSGQGSVFKPRNTGDRLHIAMLSPVNLTLNISVTAFGTTTKSVNAWSWTTIDLPDNAEIILDAGNTMAQQNVYIRWTNQDIS